MYLCLQIFFHMRLTITKSILLALAAISLSLSAAATEKDTVRAEDFYIEGIREYCGGDYKDAESLLTKSLRMDPDNDAAMYYLAMISLSRGDSDRAMQMLSQASALSPENKWYSLATARLYVNIGEIPLAIDIYQDLIEKHPAKSDYYYEFIELLVRDNRLDEALSTLDKLEQLRGSDELTYNARYEILMRQNRIDEAEAVVRKMDKDFPSARAALILGDMSKSRYDDSTAMYYYHRALEIDKDFAPAYFGLAEIYRMQRNFYKFFQSINAFLSSPIMNPEMKASYLNEIVFPSGMVQLFKPQVDTMMNNTLTAHPEDTTILSLCGSYFIATDSIDKGLSLLEKNVRLHPDVKSARSAYMGQLYYLQDWKRLIEASTATTAMFPEDFTLREVLAVAYWQNGDIEEAIRTYERILKDIPQDHPMLINCCGSLGDLYHELGNRRKSYSWYEKGLKIDDDYNPILNNYAYYLSEERRNLKKAIEMSRKTVLSEPENATYLDTYGWLLFLSGEYEQAKKYLKEALVYGGKESAEVLDHYAEALFALKEYNLAFLYWGNADKLDPSLGLGKKIAERRAEAGR